MKITQIYKLNLYTIAAVCCTGVFAQRIEHKASERFAVEEDVVIRLNTSHTAVVFETWDKNTVAIDAYIEGKAITSDNKERLLENWRVETEGSSREITINAITGNFWKGKEDVPAVAHTIDITTSEEFKVLAPMISDMLSPLMERIENHPMPSALTENLASMNFDTQKFKADEEKYVQQWGAQIKEKFGDASDDVMRQWVNELSKNTTVLAANSHNTWKGEDFAQQMQAWASQFSVAIENVQVVRGNGGNVMVYSYHTAKPRHKVAVDRIIKVRMPVSANLKLNVRHGNLALPSKITNVIASLAHTPLIANEIKGEQTYIRSSYAPIQVKRWDGGQLFVNYVKNCSIQNAKNLRINADSSNIYIQELEENGAIGSSFGAITVAKLSSVFTILDMAIDNSDVTLQMPSDVPYNIAYNGTQSRISVPNHIQASARRNFGNVLVNGYHQTRNTDKVITINAKYSDVVLK